LRYFVPKLKRISADQADARSVMTGRVVDSYTNISTVKLFSHAGREEAYAQESMDMFLETVHRQMRQVTMFQTLIYLNNSVLVFAVSAMSIGFWLTGIVSVGSIAIVIGLSLGSTACRSGSCGRSRVSSRTSAWSRTAWA
jgi:ATP-binding cassette subfamily B multidrug efflux pump